jgi:hypothetical protein
MKVLLAHYCTDLCLICEGFNLLMFIKIFDGIDVFTLDTTSDDLRLTASEEELCPVELACHGSLIFMFRVYFACVSHCTVQLALYKPNSYCHVEIFLFTVQLTPVRHLKSE